MQEASAPAPAQQPSFALTQYAKATLRAETRRQQRVQQKQEVQDMAKTALHHAQRRHAQQRNAQERHAVRMQRPAHASHNQEDVAMTPCAPGLAAAKPSTIRQLMNNDYSRRPVLSRLGPSKPVTRGVGTVRNRSLFSS